MKRFSLWIEDHAWVTVANVLLSITGIIWISIAPNTTVGVATLSLIIISGIWRFYRFTQTHGLEGYGCNEEAYEAQKAIPWWKRKG